MLEYLRNSQRFISVSLSDRNVATLYFDERDKVWRPYSINSTNACSNHLRSIADKLDELNNEEVK